MLLPHTGVPAPHLDANGGVCGIPHAVLVHLRVPQGCIECRCLGCLGCVGSHTQPCCNQTGAAGTAASVAAVGACAGAGQHVHGRRRPRSAAGLTARSCCQPRSKQD